MNNMKNFGVNIHILSSESDIDELSQHISNFDKVRFEMLFKKLVFPITIVYEKYYVDKLFRDTYYTYFSNKHFEINRNFERIIIFQGEYKYTDLLDNSKYDELQKNIIGSSVLRPTNQGKFGRTLLNPNKMKLEKSYIRTSTYEISVMGKLYKIKAYPFLSQDTETMTCAETSIWTILEYYGSRYPEYRTVLPSEIISEISNLSEERTLPSRGLTFLQKSSLLKKFGFYPRVYSKKAYGKDYRKLFHYYIESGIPITISLPGHSIVCIGHAVNKYRLEKGNMEEIGNLKFIDTCNFIDKYVVIDDNQIPYTIEDYDCFSVFKLQMNLFTVPLYRRIFLDAHDAARVIDMVLKQVSPIIDYYNRNVNLGYDISVNPLVKRIFLTSSRKYKTFRITNAKSQITKEFYLKLPFPKFIWVAEISVFDKYKQKVIFGEIVLDATASKYETLNSIILIRIGDIVAYRLPNEGSSELFKRLNYMLVGFDKESLLYENNLENGEM